MRTVSFKEKKGKSVGRFGTAFGGCQGHSCFDLASGPLAQASECTCLGLFYAWRYAAVDEWRCTVGADEAFISHQGSARCFGMDEFRMEHTHRIVSFT